MLNEIFVLEKGLSAANIKVVSRHANVQSPGKSNAFHIRLNGYGRPVEASLLTKDRISNLWTLRNGNHNSFPYVQWDPLLEVPNTASGWSTRFSEDWHKAWKEQSPQEKREELESYINARNDKNSKSYKPNERVKVNQGLQNSLQSRLNSLQALSQDADAAVIPAVIKRFQRFTKGENSISALVNQIMLEVKNGDEELIDLGRDALIGRKVREGRKEKIKGCAFYFDVPRGEFNLDVADQRHASTISRTLSLSGNSGSTGRCDLTGDETQLHAGPFPQPTIGSLGQVYLFSKNENIKAAGRYGSYADKALKVGAELMQRLAGALDAITETHRKGQTWRSIPSEKPKKSDLLLAFVDTALDEPVADILADDDEPADPEQTFLARAQRVIEAFKGKSEDDFRRTPVTMTVLRKVDTGNAKAILHRTFSVRVLYEAVRAWDLAEKNLPDWPVLPAKAKNGHVRRRHAPHIAPLQLPRLTRVHFIHVGRDKAKREPVGLGAQDALALFLGERRIKGIARSTLHLILERQGTLCSGTAQALRKDGAGKKFNHAKRKKFNHAKKYDWSAALQTVSLIGLCLAKLGRQKEEYMNEVAFKLGQLLAVADTVHVGYCADMRGGKVPPTLLGNSVLAMAQSNPIKALALLSRRWKPYGAWAKRPSLRSHAQQLKNSSKEEEKRRGWDILKAVSQAHRVDELCGELHAQLLQRVDDTFRAELLLGYMAGLPKSQSGSDENEREEIKR